MELGMKHKFIHGFSLLSYWLGFMNLLVLNIAILAKRNIFSSHHSTIIIFSVIIGLVSLWFKRDLKSVLGLIMSSLTGVAILVIVVFSLMINTSP